MDVGKFNGHRFRLGPIDLGVGSYVRIARYLCGNWAFPCCYKTVQSDSTFLFITNVTDSAG